MTEINEVDSLQEQSDLLEITDVDENEVKIVSDDYDIVDNYEIDEEVDLDNVFEEVDYETEHVFDDVDTLLKDYDKLDVTVIDTIDTKIIPETPKTVPGEQLYIYVNDASNDVKGIIQGTYRPNLLLTTDLKVMVDVQLGKIRNIYVKRSDKEEVTEERLDEYLQKLQNYINDIVDGNIVVDKALSDSEGNIFTRNYLKNTPQTFTDEEKAIMRDNIGAGAAIATSIFVNGSFIGTLKFKDDPQKQIDDIVNNTPSKTSDLNNDGDGNSPFATERYVEENGGKIDSISVGGVKQTIDNNKNVNLEISKEAIGLNNVDNTSDKDKPISDVQQIALNGLQTQISTEKTERINNINTVKSSINEIKEVIPNQATPQNQLADKDFVNSSIETATATFKGTFTNLDTLKATQADNNDYAFYDYYVADNRTFDKYKYDGTQWKYEYSLNNSSFTDAQWKAINSGITVELKNQILTNTDSINNLLNTVTELNTNKADKTAIPTNNNQLTNGAGYITASRPAGAGIEFKSKDATHFMLYGNPQVSELYTQIKQTDGTNHYVKVMDLAGKLYSNNKEVAIKDDIPTAYVKDASVTDDVLTIEKQDGTKLQFEGGGNKEDVNLSQLRTEVIYDMSDPNKNWGYTSGIQGGVSVVKDLSKYSNIKIYYQTYFASYINGGGNSNILFMDLEKITDNYSIAGNMTAYFQTNNTPAGGSSFSFQAKYNHSTNGLSFLFGYGTTAELNNSQYFVYKIEGVLKTPAMIYTGAELHEGNGISIKDGVISGVSIKELWTNNNMTASIPSEKTITLNSANYDFLIIPFRTERNGGSGYDGTFRTAIVPKGEKGILEFITNAGYYDKADDSVLWVRRFLTYVNDTTYTLSVSFARNWMSSSYKADRNFNGNVIPYKIWGVKL